MSIIALLLGAYVVLQKFIPGILAFTTGGRSEGEKAGKTEVEKEIQKEMSPVIEET